MKFEVEPEFIHREKCVRKECKRKSEDTKGKTCKCNLEDTEEEEEEDEKDFNPDSFEGSLYVNIVQKQCAGNS